MTRLLDNNRYYVIAIAIVLLLDVGKNAALWSMGQYPLYKDRKQYWKLGEQFADGDLLLAEDALVQRPPGYPVFLAACQSIFGEHGLSGAAILQHVMVVATSILAAYGCYLLTRSRWAVLLTLILMLLCLSRAWYADSTMPETPFTLLLTGGLVALIAWHQRPTLGKIALAGLLIGTSVMFKAVSQSIWPVVLFGIVAAWLWSGQNAKRMLTHALVFVVVMMAVGIPWRIRNQQLFDQAFVSKSLGRGLWLSAFSDAEIGIGNDGAGIPIPTDGLRDEDARVLASLRPETDKTHTWAVFRDLESQGVPRLAIEGFMKRVAIAGVRQHPATFIHATLRKSAKFWWVTHVKDRGQARYEETPTTAIGWSKYLYRLISTSGLPWLNSLVAIVTLVGTLTLVSQKEHRAIGLTLLGFFTYFCVVTAIAGQPSYRYRMVIEPVMVSGFVVGLRTFAFRAMSFAGRPARTSSDALQASTTAT